jgi:hypothetical protein
MVFSAKGVTYLFQRIYLDLSGYRLFAVTTIDA